MKFLDASVLRPGRDRSSRYLRQEDQNTETLTLVSLEKEIAGSLADILVILPKEPNDLISDLMLQMRFIANVLLLYADPTARKLIYDHTQAFVPALEKAYQEDLKTEVSYKIPVFQMWMHLLSPEQRVLFQQSQEKEIVLSRIEAKLRQTRGKGGFLESAFMHAFLFPEHPSQLASTGAVWDTFLLLVDEETKAFDCTVAVRIEVSDFFQLICMKVAAMCPEFHSEKQKPEWSAAIPVLLNRMRENVRRKEWQFFAAYALILKTFLADSMHIDASGVQFLSHESEAAPPPLPERSLV